MTTHEQRHAAERALLAAYDGNLTAEGLVDLADRIKCADYWRAVRSLAEFVANSVREGRELDEALHETVDGSQWVIYTRRNFDVLRYCSNHDAYTDETGEPPTTDGKEVNWAALAYCALLEDVRDAIPEVEVAKAKDGEAAR